MSNGEESPMTFMMLPDDLLLNCLARVSKMYYPSLSLVSKRFRSLLASTEFQKVRSFLGCTGSCLYVCLWLRMDYVRPIWFTLRQRPNNHSKSLVQVSSPNSLFGCDSSVAAVDSNIYVIGGLTNNNVASSSVISMDCHTHTWREIPNMHVARRYPSTCVLNGKIYVIGGRKNLDSTNFIEVFDTKAQTWEFLQIPSKEICGHSKYKSVECEGTIYVSPVKERVVYKIHKDKWRMAHLAISYFFSSCNCVVQNIFYRYRYNCYYGGKIIWYDSDDILWKTLKGLPMSFLTRISEDVKMVDYGGNIVLLWEEYKADIKMRLIWCAEIALEKKQLKEIWGTLMWSEVVYIADNIDWLSHVLVADV